MKIQDITEAGIDRRGFLRGLGAAAGAAMVPGLAKAAGQVDFKSIAIAIKDIFVQHLKLSGNAQPTAAGKFKFTFNKQGKLVGKEQIESCGDKQLDAAVLQSATNIPATLVDKWQANTPTVSIAFGVGDGWWKAAVPAQEKPQVQQAQPTTQTTTSTPNEQSDFSIKGIKFGMTREEIGQVLGAKVSGTSIPIDTLLGLKVGLLFGSYNDNGDKGLIEISCYQMGGVGSPTVEFISQFKEKFGKPSSIDNTPIKNKMGASFDNIKAVWLVKDCRILASTGGGLGKINTGEVVLTWTKALNQSINKDKEAKKLGLNDI